MNKHSFLGFFKIINNHLVGDERDERGKSSNNKHPSIILGSLEYFNDQIDYIGYLIKLYVCIASYNERFLEMSIPFTFSSLTESSFHSSNLSSLSPSRIPPFELNFENRDNVILENFKGRTRDTIKISISILVFESFLIKCITFLQMIIQNKFKKEILEFKFAKELYLNFLILLFIKNYQNNCKEILTRNLKLINLLLPLLYKILGTKRHYMKGLKEGNLNFLHLIPLNLFSLQIDGKILFTFIKNNVHLFRNSHDSLSAIKFLIKSFFDDKNIIIQDNFNNLYKILKMICYLLHWVNRKKDSKIPSGSLPKIQEINEETEIQTQICKIFKINSKTYKLEEWEKLKIVLIGIIHEILIIDNENNSNCLFDLSILQKDIIPLLDSLFMATNLKFLHISYILLKRNEISKGEWTRDQFCKIYSCTIMFLNRSIRKIKVFLESSLVYSILCLLVKFQYKKSLNTLISLSKNAIDHQSLNDIFIKLLYSNNDDKNNTHQEFIINLTIQYIEMIDSQAKRCIFHRILEMSYLNRDLHVRLIENFYWKRSFCMHRFNDFHIPHFHNINGGKGMNNTDTTNLNHDQSLSPSSSFNLNFNINSQSKLLSILFDCELSLLNDGNISQISYHQLYFLKNCSISNNLPKDHDDKNDKMKTIKMKRKKDSSIDLPKSQELIIEKMIEGKSWKMFIHDQRDFIYMLILVYKFKMWDKLSNSILRKANNNSINNINNDNDWNSKMILYIFTNNCHLDRLLNDIDDMNAFCCEFGKLLSLLPSFDEIIHDPIGMALVQKSSNSFFDLLKLSLNPLYDGNKSSLFMILNHVDLFGRKRSLSKHPFHSQSSFSIRKEFNSIMTKRERNGKNKNKNIKKDQNCDQFDLIFEDGDRMTDGISNLIGDELIKSSPILSYMSHLLTMKMENKGKGMKRSIQIKDKLIQKYVRFMNKGENISSNVSSSTCTFRVNYCLSRDYFLFPMDQNEILKNNNLKEKLSFLDYSSLKDADSSLTISNHDHDDYPWNFWKILLKFQREIDWLFWITLRKYVKYKKLFLEYDRNYFDIQEFQTLSNIIDRMKDLIQHQNIQHSIKNDLKLKE